MTRRIVGGMAVLIVGVSLAILWGWALSSPIPEGYLSHQPWSVVVGFIVFLFGGLVGMIIGTVLLAFWVGGEP